MPAQTAYSYSAVTPHNSTNIATGVCDALWIGVGGDVAVNSSQNETVVFKNVPSGFLLLVRTRRVNATSTTATDIVALYA